MVVKIEKLNTPIRITQYYTSLWRASVLGRGAEKIFRDDLADSIFFRGAMDRGLEFDDAL